MADYQFYKEGGEIAYGEHGVVVFKRRIDIPNLVANGLNGGLATAASDPETRIALPSTGFAAADTLRVFTIPAGTLIQQAGVRVVTAETLAATWALGDSDDAADWMAALDISSVGSKITLVGDGYGANTLMGKVYTTADYLLATTATQASVAAVMDFWMVGYRIWNDALDL